MTARDAHDAYRYLRFIMGAKSHMKRGMLEEFGSNERSKSEWLVWWTESMAMMILLGTPLFIIVALVYFWI